MAKSKKTFGMTKKAAAFGGLFVLALTLGACSSDGGATEPEGNSDAFDESIAEMLPESVRDGGVLNVAVPDGSPPLSSVDDTGNAVGMDPDFAQALGDIFGLDVNIVPGTFDSQVPGLQAGRYHIAMGEYYVTETRLAAVDFVTEWRDYSSFATLAENDWAPETGEELCGYRVGVMKGSAEESSVNAFNGESCGTDSMEINAFPDQAASFLALDSGRIDAVVTGRGPLEAAVGNNERIKITGEFGGGPTATAVARNEDSEEMLQALQAAFNSMIESGTYGEILEEWGTEYGAVESADIYTEDSTPPVYG